MDTPTYPSTVTIGGADQTTLFTGLPTPTKLEATALVNSQSGKVILTLVDHAGIDFDLGTATATANFVPYNSDVTPVPLSSVVVAGNVVTATWIKDTIPAEWSTFTVDRDGAISLIIKIEESPTEDYLELYTRFNIVDGNLSGDAQTTPAISFQYSWTNAIASEWAKYGRGTPTEMDSGVAILAGAGKNDWGTVIDKDLTTSPAGVDNAQYILAGIGGDWSTGTIGDIARYSATDSTWYFKTPSDGNFVYVADENKSYIFDGATWSVDQVTHTGQVTGSTNLTVDATAITDQSTVTAAAGDLLLASRAGVLQNIDVADFNGNMSTSVYDLAAVNEQLVGLTASQSLTNKDINGVTLASGGLSTQYLSADGTYNTPAGAGDMDTSTYDPANVNEQLVGLVAVQALLNKTVNGVNLQSTGLPTVFLNATGGYSTPAGGGDMSTSTYDVAAVNEQLVGLTASQNLTNKSVNGVTLVTGGSAVQYLSQDGTYNTPAGAGDMLKAAYDAANINEQVVGLVAVQVLTNKTINGVVLDASGSAVLFLNQQGNYVTPAGGGDMVAANYDPANVNEQLVGLTATQSLTNKDINGVTLVNGGSSVLFLNQFGTYTSPASGGGVVDTVASADGSVAVTGTADIDLSVTNKDQPNDQTGLTYTLVLTDAGKTIWGLNASAQTFTIPNNSSVAFPINTTILIMQEGAGAITIVGDSSVLVNNVLTGSVVTNNQFQGATLTKRAVDSWVISGDVT